jgi:hypothetical protein
VIYDLTEHYSDSLTPAENAAILPMTIASWALPLAAVSLLVAIAGSIRLQLGHSATWRTFAVSVSAFVFALVILGITVAYGQ